MKVYKKIILFLSVAVTVLSIFFCLFSLYWNKVTIQLNGFAVDSKERLYIGKSERIEVYDNGILQYTINPRTGRGYTFTITERDVLIVNTGDYIYEMDLMGEKVYRKYSDRSDNKYDGLGDIIEIFTENGNTYTLKNKYLRYKFVKNGEQTVYEMPLYDFIVKIAFFSAVILSFFSALFFLFNLDEILPAIKRWFF